MTPAAPGEHRSRISIYCLVSWDRPAGVSRVMVKGSIQQSVSTPPRRLRRVRVPPDNARAPWRAPGPGSPLALRRVRPGPGGLALPVPSGECRLPREACAT